MTIYNPSESIIRLSPDQVKCILSEADEVCPDCIGDYGSLDEMASKVRGTENWSMGEVFVFAESAERFIVMKQIAPASCEMLTISPRGVEDVLTAYRFSQAELVGKLESYLLS